MRRHLAICAFLPLVLLATIVFGSCASAPDRNDPNFLGNYPKQDIETVMVNVVSKDQTELTPIELAYVLNPKKNQVEMNFRYQGNISTLYLTEENRNALLDAMGRYIDDYQHGKLVKEHDEEKSYFGSIFSSYMWGLLSTAYYAKTELRFEYSIVGGKRPYFLLASDMTKETDFDGNPKDNPALSPALRIVFSPIQCQHVIELLKQDALLKIVSDLDAESSAFDLPETESGTYEMF